MKGQKTYRNIQIGDKITARMPSYYDEGQDRCIRTDKMYDGWLSVIKAFPHGVRTKEKGYVNHKRIINVLREDHGRNC